MMCNVEFMPNVRTLHRRRTTFRREAKSKNRRPNGYGFSARPSSTLVLELLMSRNRIRSLGNLFADIAHAECHKVEE